MEKESLPHEHSNTPTSNPPNHPPKKLLPFHTSKEQRVANIKPIMQKLNELELNMSYPAIKRLYKEMSDYMKDGESRKINIAFPEVKRRIKGFLSGDTRKETWVKLEADE